MVRSIEEDYVLKVESINGNYSVDVKSLKELVFFRSVLGLLYQTYADISAQLWLAYRDILQVKFLQVGVIIGLAILLANFKGK